MKVSVNWKEKMQFVATAGQQEVLMDAKTPIGQGRGQTPKELLVSSLSGCTAMDVIAWLRKHKQEPSSFEINAQAKLVEKGYPAVITELHLSYVLTGNLSLDVTEEAIRLSQSKYCGVSAMLAKAFPITWELILNDQKVAEGRADFN